MKFWEKSAEALGTALILLVVMDIFFKALIAKVHAIDHEGQRSGKEWLEERRSRQAENEKLATKEAQEHMAQSLNTLLRKVDQVEQTVKDLKRQ